MRARIFTPLLSFALIAGVTACGGSGDDATADITIDGKKLDGDLSISCDQESMGGAPNSIYITEGDGEVTYDGRPIEGSLTISIGYGEESGGTMEIEGVVVTVPNVVEIVAAAAGNPVGYDVEMTGESDDETWTFSYSGPAIGESDSTHTVEGTVTC